VLSASQVQAWLDCPRKWSFQYKEHIARGQNASAAFGSLVHKILEEYYQGMPLPFSSMDEETGHAAEVAFAMLEHLPNRAPHLVNEGKFVAQVGRHEYIGFIDMTDESTHTVHDFKTTSNFKYIKRGAELQGNVQAVLYAARMLERWKVPEVNLQWTYGRTRGKAISDVTRIVMTAEGVAPLVQVLDTVADEIEAARGKRTLDLLPNPHMCDAYGGCPFEHICNLSPKERLQAVMTQSATDDLLARLAAARSTPSAPATSAAERTLPLPGVPVAPGQINPPEGAQAAPPAPAPTPDPAPPAATKRPRKPKPEPRDTGRSPDVVEPTNPIGTLYIRCQPLEGDYVGFGSVLEDAEFIIKATPFRDSGEEYYVSDYRFVHYGQGPAVLVSAVQQALSEKRIEHLVVRDSPEAQICTQHLMMWADRVIVGL